MLPNIPRSFMCFSNFNHFLWKKGMVSCGKKTACLISVQAQHWSFKKPKTDIKMGLILFESLAQAVHRYYTFYIVLSPLLCFWSLCYYTNTFFMKKFFLMWRNFMTKTFHNTGRHLYQNTTFGTGRNFLS